MATKKETSVVKKEPNAVKIFQKEALLRASIFANRKDVLAAVVKDDEALTIEEALERLDKFMKERVK